MLILGVSIWYLYSLTDLFIYLFTHSFIKNIFVSLWQIYRSSFLQFFNFILFYFIFYILFFFHILIANVHISVTK